VSQTVDWLDHNGIPYWDLCFMKEKEQVGASVYIDDTPSNVERLRSKAHYTICFANSTNREIGPPRATTWRDVYDLVLAYAKAQAATVFSVRFRIGSSKRTATLTNV